MAPSRHAVFLFQGGNQRVSSKPTEQSWRKINFCVDGMGRRAQLILGIQRESMNEGPTGIRNETDVTGLHALNVAQGEGRSIRTQKLFHFSGIYLKGEDGVGSPSVWALKSSKGAG
jgi:hypothetical protein